MESNHVTDPAAPPTSPQTCPARPTTTQPPDLSGEADDHHDVADGGGARDGAHRDDGDGREVAGRENETPDGVAESASASRDVSGRDHAIRFDMVPAHDLVAQPEDAEFLRRRGRGPQVEEAPLPTHAFHDDLVGRSQAALGAAGGHQRRNAAQRQDDQGRL